MRKRFKINLIIYNAILIFAFLFMLVLRGASGHKFNFTLFDYLLPFYIILSISSLKIYPRISKSGMYRKFIFGLAITLLFVSLILAVYLFYMILGQDSNAEAVLVALIFFVVFIMVSCYLIYYLLEFRKSTSQ